MTPTGRLIFNIVGVLAVVGLLVMVIVTNGFEPFIYRGGLLLCSLLTAIAIAVLVHPISWISKVFELPPFVWIGKWSYSMYLWHFPIILLLTPTNMQGGTPWWLCLIELALVIGISAFLTKTVSLGSAKAALCARMAFPRAAFLPHICARLSVDGAQGENVYSRYGSLEERMTVPPEGTDDERLRSGGRI